MNDDVTPQDNQQIAKVGTVPIYDISGDQATLGEVPHDDVQAAVISGKYSLPKGRDVQVIAPDGSLGSVPAEDAEDAFKGGYKYATPTLLAHHQEKEHYESFPQQALGTFEAVSKGIAGPISTAAEKFWSKLGVPGLTPEEQRKREEHLGIAAPIAEAAGFIGGLFTPVGEAALLEKAGVKAAELAGRAITKGVARSASEQLGARISAGAAKVGLEMALMQTADEASKAINNDPNQSSQSALANIGLSGVLGGAGGATLGALGGIHALWKSSNNERVSKAVVDLKSTLEGNVEDPIQEITKKGLFGRLAEQKPNAPEITAAADRNGWPVFEGMTSNSKEIQQAEDALLNGPPTIASIGRRKIYQEAFDSAGKAVNEATAAPVAISETEAGNVLKQSLTNKLSSEYEPIKNLYSAMEPYQEAIQVSDKSTGALSRTIRKIIEDENLIKGTPEYNFVETMSDGIGQVNSLANLKSFRTALGRASGPETRFVSSLITEKLAGVEERAIKRFADTMKTGVAKDKILSLIDQSNVARGQYAAFREKLATLGESLGKKKIYGPQDFIDFIGDMNPQQLAKRLFTERNTEFANYFAKNFPEEFQTMRGYQRGLLRETATKEGLFNAPKAIKTVNEMEPEIKKLLFNEKELGTVKDAKTYLESFPKNFNPSGTAHETAFRAFFEHPTGALISNFRDYGIQRFIKAFGHAVPGAEKEADQILPALAMAIQNKEVKPEAFKHAVEYSMAAIKENNLIRTAAKSLFSGIVSAGGFKENRPSKEDLTKLDERVKDISKTPSKMFYVGGELNHYLPGHAQALSQTSMIAVNYLNSIRPQSVKKSPLDKEIPPSKAQEAAYTRQLEIAQQPLLVFQHMKDGTLQAQDIQTLKTIYPDYYNKMSQQVMTAMTDHLSKDEHVPYKLRQSASLFLGQPLDSTMIPTSIQSIQAGYAARSTNQQQAATGQKVKKGTAKLGQTSENMLSPNQARQQRSSQI